MQKALEKLSPFELKDRLISLARNIPAQRGPRCSTQVAATPIGLQLLPAAHFSCSANSLLRSRNASGAGRTAEVCPGKMYRQAPPGFPQKETKMPLARACCATASTTAAESSALILKARVHELTDGVIGDQYPVPVRMLKLVERVVHDYLCQEICGEKPPRGRYDLFAVEGGTAGICYVLDSLLLNNLLHHG